MASHHGVESSFEGRDSSFSDEKKEGPGLLAVVDEESPSDTSLQDEINGISGDTAQDMRDMLRLGKKQEFKRNFSLISTLGFISIYMGELSPRYQSGHAPQRVNTDVGHILKPHGNSSLFPLLWDWSTVASPACSGPLSERFYATARSWPA